MLRLKSLMIMHEYTDEDIKNVFQTASELAKTTPYSYQSWLNSFSTCLQDGKGVFENDLESYKKNYLDR